MSADQAKVQLHDKSPFDGELIMVGKDGIGVRVNAFQLKAHRYVHLNGDRHMI
jgi:hypothetical protein